MRFSVHNRCDQEEKSGSKDHPVIVRPTRDKAGLYHNHLVGKL